MIRTSLASGLLILFLGCSMSAWARPVASAGAAPGESLPIAVVSSLTNQRVFESRNQDYRSGVKYWLARIADTGMPYRVVGDYELETGIRDAALLIVNQAERLSDQQIRNIEAFRASGRGVIHVGMTGLYNEVGTRRTMSLPEKWLGLQNVDTYNPTDNHSAYFTVSGLSFLAAAVEPGFRMEAGWGRAHWYCNHPKPAAMYVDWGLNPLLPKEGPALEASTALVIGDFEGTRVAWLGFEPEEIPASGEQAIQAARMFASLVRWGANRPLVMRAPWPEGHSAAAVIIADIQGKPEAEALKILLEQEKVPSTVFLPGKVAREYPDAASALSGVAQIGSTPAWDPNAGTMSGRSFEDQLREISAEVENLKTAGVPNPQGFWPPMEDYDANTLEAIAAAGLEFVFGHKDLDRSFPNLLKLDHGLLYQFPRICPDAYYVVGTLAADTPERYGEEFAKIGTRMLKLGALFTFKFHLNPEEIEANIKSIQGVIQWIKANDFWLATFSDVVTWARSRDALKVSLNTMASGKLELVLENPSTMTIKAFPLIYFPSGTDPNDPLVNNSYAGLKASPLDSGGFSVLADLGPGETKRIILK